MDIKTLESFRLSDAISFHDELNPKLWSGMKLRPEVKQQLKKIADDFMDELGISGLDIVDVTVSGSNAAYSYTPHSDLDLHLLVDMSDMPNDEVYRELFNAKKNLYNDSHDITIHGVPIEVYVQDASEPVVSLGEYSIKNNDWIKLPTKRRANLDQTATRSKYNKLLDKVNTALKSNNLKKINKTIKKIRQYRQAGLDKGGEFGPENLAYKVLRSQGYINKLYQLRDKLHSEVLTIENMYQNPEEVQEAVGDNYLYHATQPAGMMRILRTGMIKASWRPQEATKARTQYPTVSTTRSKQYAESEDFVDFLNLTKEGNAVIIVFDRNAVANHYKMFSTSQGTQTVGDEYEEVIVVPKGSMPVKGTMKGFYFNPRRSAEIQEFQDAPWFKELLNSPYYMGPKNQNPEKVQEAVHPDVTSDEYFIEPTKNVRMGDFVFNARTFTGGLSDPNARGLQIRAYDPTQPKGHNLIGSADFIVKSDKKGNQWLESDDTEVNDEYRGKGVAAMMYAFAKTLGNDIKSSPYQSQKGREMWKKWGKDAEHLAKESVEEGSLNEYRDRMYQYLKSIVPGFPDYVVKDWLYANFARGATQGPGWSFDTIGKDIPKILKDIGLSVDTKWKLVPNMKFTMDMWEPKTLKRLQARAGGSSKTTDPDVHIPAKDAERHATQAALAKQQGGVRKEPVILIKTPQGYQLLEGWHRTIQHFAKYPEGYTGPAYIAVAQGQQDMAEDLTQQYASEKTPAINPYGGLKDRQYRGGISEASENNLAIFYRGEPILTPERLEQLKASIGKPYPILRKEGSAANIGTYMSPDGDKATSFVKQALAGQGKGGTVTKIAVDPNSFQNGDGGIDEAVIITNIAGLVSDKEPDEKDPLRINDRKQAMLKYLGPGVRKYLSDPLLSNPLFVEKWYDPEFAHKNWDTIKSGKQAVTKPGESQIQERMMKLLGPIADKIRRDPQVIDYFLTHNPGDWVEYNFRMNSDGSGTKVLDVKYYPPVTKESVGGNKITLSTDPNWYGADVGDYKATSPVVNIPANQLVGFEPDAKMNQPKSKANVEKIIAGLKQGAKLPPILVRQYKNGYQVVDGHHRFWAYKLLGIKSIPAQIVPNEDIIVKESASGYIPSYAEKDDPRFKTALTVDIKPDTLKKNAQKLGSKISRAGIPPTLRANGKF